MIADLPWQAYLPFPPPENREVIFAALWLTGMILACYVGLRRQPRHLNYWLLAGLSSFLLAYGAFSLFDRARVITLERSEDVTLTLPLYDCADSSAYRHDGARRSGAEPQSLRQLRNHQECVVPSLMSDLLYLCLTMWMIASLTLSSVLAVRIMLRHKSTRRSLERIWNALNAMRR